MVESVKRSHTTHVPAASAGRMVFATCSARAAKCSSVSAAADHSTVPPSSRFAQHFGARRATRLARAQHRQAQVHQRLGEQPRLGGLAGPFAAFQRDER